MQNTELDFNLQLDISDRVEQAIAYIEKRLDSKLVHPPIGIICGSGLAGLSHAILPHPRSEIDYAQIPFFPRSTGTQTANLM